MNGLLLVVIFSVTIINGENIASISSVWKCLKSTLFDPFVILADLDFICHLNIILNRLLLSRDGDNSRTYLYILVGNSYDAIKHAFLLNYVQYFYSLLSRWHKFQFIRIQNLPNCAFIQCLFQRIYWLEKISIKLKTRYENSSTLKQ